MENGLIVSTSKANFGTSPPYEDLPEMKVKSNVRKRDGFKCRDCGITQDDHLAECSRDLEVHRLIPGVVYRDYLCVTLCRACHNKKPRKTGDAFWAKDLIWFGLNLYNPVHRKLLDELMEAHGQNLGTIADLIMALLQKHLEDIGQERSMMSASL